MQMRNDAIVCNIGHFDCEIDVKGCARFFGAVALSIVLSSSKICILFMRKKITVSLYRVTNQVVPKLSIQGQFKSHSGPETRVWEQSYVSPCTKL